MKIKSEVRANTSTPQAVRQAASAQSVRSPLATQQRHTANHPATMQQRHAALMESSPQAMQMKAHIARINSSSGQAVFQHRAIPVAQGVIQKAPPAIDMAAGVGDLKASWLRKRVVDNIYRSIKEDSLSYKITDFKKTLKFLKEEYSGRKYHEFRSAESDE